MSMRGELDLEVSWTFQAFGPRVYECEVGGRTDQSVNWALDCVHHASHFVKPCMRDG